MQFGKRAERIDECPAGACPFAWPDIKNYLFQGRRFGAFCDRFTGVFHVSCVLNKGGNHK